MTETTEHLDPFALAGEPDPLLTDLSPAEQRFVDGILKMMPAYRYDLSRLPKIDPPPAPGLPSVLAALRAIKARLEPPPEKG